ncbi:MAG: asparaginase [Armatimonadetes bacterium]|nr:asparaginase [Armatimonadota bacterium]
MTLPLVHVLTTGGTIAGKLQASGEVAPGLTAEDLLERIPPVRNHARLRIENVFNVASAFIGPEEMLQLARRARDVLAEPDVAGVVVTHGTGTLIQSAYFLDVTVGSPKPIVFTGAMRNPMMLSDDGPGNLFHAILTAASPASRDLGVLVTMSNHIHSAQTVVKTQTSTPGAFVSREFGPLGTIQEERVYYANRPYSRLRTVMPERITARVERASPDAGSKGFQIRALLAAGLDGIVVEAQRFGDDDLKMLTDAMARGVRVVIASPYGAGRPHLGTYRHKGGEAHLVELGMIYSGSTGQKARIKLLVALSAGLSFDEIRDWFHAEWA